MGPGFCPNSVLSWWHNASGGQPDAMLAPDQVWEKSQILVPDNFQGYWNKKIIDLQISIREANQLIHRLILLPILFLSNNPMLLLT